MQSINHHQLPALTSEEEAHSQRLQEIIIETIQRNKGKITFQQFMQMALYYPGLGYYRSGSKKFGVGGDFITAPELSPLFSRCVARQAQQVLQALPASNILELGAGTGIMALEILRELERVDCLPNHYFILELSAELKQRQQSLFRKEAPHLLSKVEWCDHLPPTMMGVIVANEVMDAMPVHKIKIEQELKEFWVQVANGHFDWYLDAPSTPELIQAFQSLPLDLAEGYCTEFNLLLSPWIKSLADCLQQGLILLIDYGYVRREYFHPERSMGTLMCHFRHRAHDNPLILPGIQDITAHVDFTAVAMAAVRAGLEVGGFTHQAGFLLNSGLMDFYQDLLSRDAVEQYRLAQQIKRLTLPSEMGERFKAIALTTNFDEPLVGFSAFDQSDWL